ncbi:YopX family protein [Dyadobacter sp. 3J3]|uniref:YopX family protein n=1 Tax=Dyadobacter sp. 3J3 TaxID=2606600 RepID=UPI00135C5904|nr:YopX family protein [Dyadobacter sp. 3J3]
MKREIIFRAKSVHNGEWVYGNFIHSKRFAGCGNEFRIHNPETGLESDVIPETVGQFIGMEDIKTIAIYEGDIVQEYVMEDRFEIVFSDYGNWGMKSNYPILKDMEYETIDPSYASTTLRIIGNIHENPDLITSQQK